MNDQSSESLVKARLGSVLESALNQALSLDPDLPGELGALHGRSLDLCWTGPGWALRISVDGERLRVGPSDAAASDLSLRASLPGLLGLVGLTRAGSGQGLPTGQVQIAGDAELLRKIERLGRRFDPDWELALANRLGPVFGPQLARQVRAAFAWLKTSGQSLAESSAEYLSEEGKDSIARAEQDEFAQQVAELRDGVERAEARLVRLAAKLGRP